MTTLMDQQRLANDLPRLTNAKRRFDFVVNESQEQGGVWHYFTEAGLVKRSVTIHGVTGIGTTDIEAADDWCDQMLDRLGVAA